jgi:hypothetical protein
MRRVCLLLQTRKDEIWKIKVEVDRGIKSVRWKVDTVQLYYTSTTRTATTITTTQHRTHREDLAHLAESQTSLCPNGSPYCRSLPRLDLSAALLQSQARTAYHHPAGAHLCCQCLLGVEPLYTAVRREEGMGSGVLDCVSEVVVDWRVGVGFGSRSSRTDSDVARNSGGTCRTTGRTTCMQRILWKSQATRSHRTNQPSSSL